MKHASQSQFGRPVEAVQNPSLQEGPDKWELLKSLTDAADEFDLSHRTLSVLKALLTFLPARHIPYGPAAVVFPSNKTLSDRLSGMPESTLRRHLNKLVQSGIVSRQDSPNRKRYARHVGAGVAVAYGFDLAPLAALHADLITLAQRARAKRDQLLALRDRMLCLRATVIDLQGQSPLTDDIARLARRKPEEEALMKAIQDLTDLVDNHPPSASETIELSTCDSQNERHIQDDIKYGLDPEGTDTQKTAHAESSDAEKRKMISLAEVIERCQAYKGFFPDMVRSWRDIISISDRLAPMVGIDQPVMHQAKKTMGAEATAVVILCILEKMESIRSPGAYLRHLIKVAMSGHFSILPMLRAVKSENCQLTI